MMPAMAAHLPATATDDDLLRFVDGWARLLESEDYVAVFQYTAHDPYMHWTPNLIREVIKGYDEGDAAQKVTLAGMPTDVYQRKEVIRWPESRPGGIGEIWYDLNINGYVSDLTATFAIQESANGLTIVLEEISVM
jgi:hypothetical protein